MAKLQGFEFWKKTLKEARFVVAPMVDQSELAWRLLSRRHGAQLCYTPMLHAQVFVRDTNYRRDNLYSEICKEDRPLITQFCANDPEVFIQAALLAQDHCDAIDLNLGCPQMIAKRGHYGVFLQDEWELLEKMIKLANEKLSVPITCKIRVFNEMEKTVSYAQMLEKAGCQLLTIHGRTKDQKGPMTGIASWEHIKAVRKAVNIPVFANGNIQHLSDVEHCIQETGVQGVMSAEGNLHNPALFEGNSPPVWEMAEEYLELVQQYPPCTLSYVRAHLFKLWHHTLQIHQDLREELGKVKNLESLADVSKRLRLRCQEEIAKGKDVEEKEGSLPFPHWICQPYVRPVPKDPDANGNSKGSEVKKTVCQKRALEGSDGSTDKLSKNKQKKITRNPRKKFGHEHRPKYIKCEECGNPKGNKCVFNHCRGCCKKKAYKEVADCPGHGLRFKTKAEKLKADENNGKDTSETERSCSPPQPVPETERSCSPPQPVPETERSCSPPQPVPETERSCSPPQPVPETERSCSPPQPVSETERSCSPPQPVSETERSYSPPKPVPETERSCSPPQPVSETERSCSPPQPVSETERSCSPPQPVSETERSYSPPKPVPETERSCSPPQPVPQPSTEPQSQAHLPL